MISATKKEDYNSEPVRYCSKCFSLKIKYEDTLGFECCADCGCSEISEAPIDIWEKKYIKKYGHRLVVKNEDPKKTYIFKLSINDLKTKVYKYLDWRTIVYSIYPNFPGGYGREDSIILFFDKLYRDNRIDDLRLLLWKMKL